MNFVTNLFKGLSSKDKEQLDKKKDGLTTTNEEDLSNNTNNSSVKLPASNMTPATTSNASKEASQRLVHSYYFPTLAKLGIVEKIKDVYYRHTDQTVWEIHPDKFYENLNRYTRWT